MSTRRERLERRAERRRQWAGRASHKSAAGFESARRIADAIPFGQPILVGHHSERHARRDQERIENGMRKGCEMATKAKDHLSKADGIEAALERAVFDDDPDAIERLEERIAKLTAKRDLMKAANAWWKKHATMAGFEGVTPERAARMDDDIRASWDKRPWPPYSLTNIGARIRTDQKRIEQVRARQARLEKAEEAGVLVEDAGEGYVRVTFPEFPGREIIQGLKAAGFWWSNPSWAGKAENLPEGVRP